jgi:hypothetical protein
MVSSGSTVVKQLASSSSGQGFEPSHYRWQRERENSLWIHVSTKKCPTSSRLFQLLFDYVCCQLNLKLLSNGAHTVKLFTTVTNSVTWQASVFVIVSHLQPSLISATNLPFEWNRATSDGILLTLVSDIRLGWKCQTITKPLAYWGA